MEIEKRLFLCRVIEKMENQAEMSSHMHLENLSELKNDPNSNIERGGGHALRGSGLGNVQGSV